MYLSNFEARSFFDGKSALVHRLSFEHARTCICMAADCFSCTVSKMKQRQQMMLSFLSTAKISKHHSNYASYISLNFTVLHNPPLQEILFPTVGGVWIFSGTAQYTRGAKDLMTNVVLLNKILFF